MPKALWLLLSGTIRIYGPGEIYVAAANEISTALTAALGNVVSPVLNEDASGNMLVTFQTGSTNQCPPFPGAGLVSLIARKPG